MRKALILTAAAAVGLSAGLYLALSDRESPAPTAAAMDFTALEEMRAGDMTKLQFGEAPGSSVAFTSEAGDDMTLAAYEGKFALVNFWATWCAPCRKEMPQLAELQDEFGGANFEVVTIATGRNPRPAMEAFFREIGVANLPLHSDTSSALARDMGVLGLPVTLILDPAGREIARLQGDADWASEEAKAIIAALVAG
ncbi:TlpA disulfide reductase family protein [Salibaculum sp.]|uniref:TlpA family protein disulfide reductase n=1 Tax=Salibaculum sp. TaxID=2855480 RepID=UPI002B4724DD|nr:TlpA disulfide reductase family protein [Salibaculum sp.]HKL68739.1 TlpA disulfide reductase family protein [Salibaculum sp.]